MAFGLSNVLQEKKPYVKAISFNLPLILFQIHMYFLLAKIWPLYIVVSIIRNMVTHIKIKYLKDI